MIGSSHGVIGANGVIGAFYENMGIILLGTVINLFDTGEIFPFWLN